MSHLACFPYTVGFAQEALRTNAFSGLVACYNLLEMEMARFFPALEAAGRGFLCIRPFMAGLLTDRRADRQRLPADDRMQDRSWDAAYARLDQLRADLAIHSMTAFAIQFALIHPVVTSLIVGLNSEQQVDEVIDAASAPALDRSSFDQALRIFNQLGPVGS